MREPVPELRDVRGPHRRAVAALAGILVAALAVHAAHGLTGAGGSGVDAAIERWLYSAVLLGAAAICGVRALLVRERRVAWAVLTGGLVAWAAGDIYWSIAV